MKISGLRNLLLAVACCVVCTIAAPAQGADDWRAEFDATCAQTDTAMNLSVNELVALTEACERLEKVIAGLGETERKVFMKRLQMCKNLYLFVLETKRNEPAAK
jgi:hypothetical protein